MSPFSKSRIGKTASLLPIFTAAVFSFSAFSADPPKTVAQYWNETGFKMSIFEDFFLPTCNQTLAGFSACYKAAQSLAKMGKPALYLADPTEIAELLPLYTAKKIEDVTAQTALYELTEIDHSKQPFTNEQYNRINKQVRAARINFVIKSFPMAQVTPVPFTKLHKNLMARIRPELQGEKLEAYVASTLFNAGIGEFFDPHAHIDANAIFDIENDDRRVFYGIGSFLKKTDQGLEITGITKDSPSMRAGLKRKDIITTINNKSIVGMPYVETLPLIRGEKNTVVKFNIVRAGQPLEIEVKRGEIKNPNFSYELSTDGPIKIGYMKLNTFMDNPGVEAGTDIKTSIKVREAIQDLEKQGAQGFILDLQDNPGGLLDMAVEIGGHFVGKKTIVEQHEPISNELKKRHDAPEDAVTKLPLVILVDAGSASASELLAGAMQDYNRALIVGARSFGKGTVQGVGDFSKVLPFFGIQEDKVLIRKTISRFHQPSGRTNQFKGIIPNIAVGTKPGVDEDDSALREEDYYMSVSATQTTGGDWKEPNPRKIRSLQRCVERKGTRTKAYDELEKAAPYNEPNLRRLYAEDVIYCLSN